jgi:hypothetical protein
MSDVRLCHHPETDRELRVWRVGGGDIKTWFDCASWETPDAIVCTGCGAWLPLGDSDEHASEQVEIEIRAAEIAGTDLVLDGDERIGYLDHAYDFGLGAPINADQWAGYLARSIITHEDQQAFSVGRCSSVGPDDIFFCDLENGHKGDHREGGLRWRNYQGLRWRGYKDGAP